MNLSKNGKIFASYAVCCTRYVLCVINLLHLRGMSQFLFGNILH